MQLIDRKTFELDCREDPASYCEQSVTHVHAYMPRSCEEGSREGYTNAAAMILTILLYRYLLRTKLAAGH